MGIFAISDLHLSFAVNKPMDRFGPESLFGPGPDLGFFPGPLLGFESGRGFRLGFRLSSGYFLRLGLDLLLSARLRLSGGP